MLFRWVPSLGQNCVFLPRARVDPRVYLWLGTRDRVNRMFFHLYFHGMVVNSNLEGAADICDSVPIVL